MASCRSRSALNPGVVCDCLLRSVEPPSKTRTEEERGVRHACLASCPLHLNRRDLRWLVTAQNNCGSIRRSDDRSGLGSCRVRRWSGATACDKQYAEDERQHPNAADIPADHSTSPAGRGMDTHALNVALRMVRPVVFIESCIRLDSQLKHYMLSSTAAQEVVRGERVYEGRGGCEWCYTFRQDHHELMLQKTPTPHLGAALVSKPNWRGGRDSNPR